MRFSWMTFFIVLLLGASTIAFIYPQASHWLYQYNQSKAIEIMERESLTQTSPTLDEISENAFLYNEELYHYGLARVWDKYDSALAIEGSDVMARLVIPKIELDQPVRHGLDEYALINGVGHAEGSSLPIGGLNTHSVLGGHRGLAASVGFTNLPKLEIGDIFYVESLGKTMSYKVRETKVLQPEEAALHPIEEGKDLVTLLTCTPLGINSHRFVVIAERLTPDVATTADEQSNQPGFPWWTIQTVGAIAAIGIIVRFSSGGATKKQSTAV